MLVLACLGVSYGIADVAEDLKLFTIPSRGNPVDEAQAAAFNLLTRIKVRDDRALGNRLRGVPAAQRVGQALEAVARLTPRRATGARAA